MRARLAGLGIAGLAVVLLLATCGPVSTGQRPPTPAEVALGVHVEQVRAHLGAASGNARAGRWELAAVHAAHPAEDLPAISAALAPRDGAADAALRGRIADLGRAAEARDGAALEQLIDDVDARLAVVPAAVVGEARAAELSLRASVLAALVEVSADEYGEGIVDGALRNESEYQDAYAFLRRALAIWAGIGEPLARSAPQAQREIAARLAALERAMPALRPPAAPLGAEEVDALAKAVQDRLREAAGTRGAEAAAGAPELRELAKKLGDARAALRAGDAPSAKAAYLAFHEGWAGIEDGVRARDRDSYRRLEDGMRQVSDALLTPDRPDPERAGRALAALDEAVGEALPKLAAAPSEAPATSVTVASIDARLGLALAALDAADTAAAASELETFRNEWPDAESFVKARSPSAYAAIENDTARALTLLGERPPDARAARDAVARIREQLAPFVDVPASYGIFDAAIILLREGFEALLVVAALLAFLTKTGNADKRPWIWGGGAVGVLASVAVAVVVNIAFSTSAASGANRELLEGITGLVAAGMLVYVSYWLHSKSSLASWQRYIREKSSSALARNSLLSLSLISFLAVFREGAETVLFYLGITSSITLNDLALGLALGTAGLVATGVLMLVFGLRIPIRPFFLATSLLIYYLAFKFVGTGIHALQVAGIAPATSRGYLPDLGFFGVFPTWETTIVQAALLTAAVGFVLFERARSPRRAEVSSAI